MKNDNFLFAVAITAILCLIIALCYIGRLQDKIDKANRIKILESELISESEGSDMYYELLDQIQEEKKYY